MLRNEYEPEISAQRPEYPVDRLLACPNSPSIMTYTQPYKNKSQHRQHQNHTLVIQVVLSGNLWLWLRPAADYGLVTPLAGLSLREATSHHGATVSSPLSQ